MTPFLVFTRSAASDTAQAVRLGVTIEKVDKAKRIVRGVATAEVIDAHGQIVDYETAKAAFLAWKGNIREMHQPKAVGKAVEVEFDDTARQIILSAYVSKGAPDTWEKVLDRTLSQYSIGARAVVKAEKVGDALVEKLYIQRLHETSLVDAGACPGCEFEIVKMDGDQPVPAVELTDEDIAADPADGGAPAAADAGGAPSATVDPSTAGAPATKADVLGLLTMPGTARAAAYDALLARGLVADVAKRVEAYDVRAALNAIHAIEELVASEIWEAEEAKRVGAAQDTDGPAQLQLLRDASELLLAFLMSEFMAQFDSSVDATGDAVNARDAVRLAAATHVVAEAQKARRDTLTTATAPTAPAAAPSTVITLEGQLFDAMKMLTQAQDTIRAQAESVSALHARIERLEAQPMPGGPVTRGTAAAKSLGNTDADADAAVSAADPAEVVRVLMDLAEAATSQDERQRIAEKLIAFQLTTGAGRQVVTRPGA